MRYLRKNHFWFLTGFEVFALGILFLETDDFIGRPPDFITNIDAPQIAIALVLVGLYSMIASCGKLKGSVRDIVVFILLFIWSFYFIMFLIHDLAAPVMIPHFSTVFTFFIVIRILFEAFWSDAR